MGIIGTKKAAKKNQNKKHIVGGTQQGIMLTAGQKTPQGWKNPKKIQPFILLGRDEIFKCFCPPNHCPYPVRKSIN